MPETDRQRAEGPEAGEQTAAPYPEMGAAEMSAAVDMAADIDANLPLEGRIAAILPQQKGKSRVQLNIGAQHGLASRMRLEVWRPEPSQQKVGQLEVVATDSTTAIAKLRKLDKKLKKSGEGLQLQYRVISAKRRSRRSL